MIYRTVEGGVCRAGFNFYTQREGCFAHRGFIFILPFSIHKSIWFMLYLFKGLPFWIKVKAELRDKVKEARFLRDRMMEKNKV